MGIEFIEKPYKAKEVESILHPFVREWFFKKFKEFSLPQLYGVLEIHNGNNVLVSAPTGATKTLTAFLAILNELVTLASEEKLEDKVYCVYASPLKALTNDISYNLVTPLNEINEIAKKHGKKFDIRIGLRTGDTSASDRAKMSKKTPHIFVTTPESLAIVLTTTKFREYMKDVKYCIIDEIHALAENKRGVHLSLSIERLRQLTGKNFCRIGLSATVSPLKEIAQYLVGSENDCKIADVQFIKKMDLKVLSPVKDLINTSYNEQNRAMYELINNLIQEHKTTLIFTNTRAATERVVHYLKEKFPKNYSENIGAHHGSLSKESRLNLENRLRKGELKVVVCLEGNTKVLDDKGNWIKIKDIDERKVASLGNNFKLNNNKVITKITKENKDNLVKIKTSLGKEIICTKEHKFLTINKKGDVEWKETKDFNEGDPIATIRKYNYKPLTRKELNNLALENYPDDGYLGLKKEFLDKIKSKIIKRYGEIKIYWLNGVKGKLSYSTFLQDLRGNHLFRIEIIKKIIKDLKIRDNQLWKNIVCFSSDKYKAPKLEINSDIMRLLGFMSAEGYISPRALYISSRNKKLLDYYSKLIKKLSGKEPFKKLSSSGTPIFSWESIFLSKFLQNIGFKKGRKARINNIPKFVFSLNTPLVFSFLSAYLDGDGFSDTKKDGRTHSIGFSTTSKEMAEDLTRLLLREGILASIRGKYIDERPQLLDGGIIVKKGWFYEVVVIGGKNLRLFAKHISPMRENLINAKMTITSEGYSNLDTIPNLGIKLRKIRKEIGVSTYKLYKNNKLDPTKYELNNRSISRKQLSRLLSVYHIDEDSLNNLSNSDIFWEKIKSKEKAGKDESVYNIEVENEHNYIANGFITKNCSTSLELGIDIGFIDLVILLGSPKSVARCLQRIGRSGHKLHETAKGRIIVLDRDDLVECSVMLKSAIERKIDTIHIPKNCLDVLSQQIYGIAIADRISYDDLFKMIKRSYCYKDLEKKDFDEVLNYLSGEYTSLEDRYVYAKIWWDKETGMIGRKGKLSRIIYMTNIGTIPDETHVTVKVGEQIIGHIDEAFLERLKRRDVFVLGGDRYEFQFARGMVAQVKSTADRPPTIPSWFSEMLPLSFDLGMEIGRFRRLIEEKFDKKKNKDEILKFIDEYLYVDKTGAEAIYNYFNQMYLYCGDIPNDKKIIIEHYNAYNKKFIVFHTLYGRRVNDVLSRAVAYLVGLIGKRDIEIGINDNGFYLASEDKMQVKRAFDSLKSKDLDRIMEIALDKTEVLRRRFRHCAGRSLMILRTYKGRTKRVGRQQVSSMLLISAVRRISNDFPILKEARREVLEDLMDVVNAKRIIIDLENGKIKVKEIDTRIPSPFAFNLVLQGYTDIFKMEDKAEFLQRMHNLVLAKIGQKSEIN
ncbi:DEAD/DEAH box helicase [Candidatus Woesearchaeota archaeon]|nr:DEAD/DEAH box helicase [Candidatus Woesearchaeota archaeon]